MIEDFSRRTALKAGTALAASAFFLGAGSSQAQADETRYPVRELMRIFNNKNRIWTEEQKSLSQISTLSFSFNPHYWSNFYARAINRRNTVEDSYYSACVYYHKGRARLYLLKERAGRREVLAQKDLPKAFYNVKIEFSTRGGSVNSEDRVELKARVLNNSQQALGSSLDSPWDLVAYDEKDTLRGRETGHAFWVDGLKEGYSISLRELTYSFKDYSVDRVENTNRHFQNLVFEDTFSGGFIDPSKWQVRNEDYLSFDSGWIVKENAYIDENQDLNLALTKRDTVKVTRKDKKSRPYNTAFMTTTGRFSQVYGRWEMRAKMPADKGSSAGVWSAFWLRPVNKSIQGEVDIAESFGSYNPSARSKIDCANKTLASIHFKQDGSRKAAAFIPSSFDGVLSEEYHIWTFERTPESFRFYFDGELYFEQKVAERAQDFAEAFPETEPFEIYLNMQATSPGTYWGGIDEASTVLPASMKVDYIRAWSYTP